MRIEAGISFHHYSQPVRGDAAGTEDATSFMAALDETASGKEKSAKIEQADFTNMTRQELRDWMNDQIRSGEMSLDESSTFLAIGGLVQIDANGRAIPGGADDRIQNERVNFFEIAQNGMDFYRLRGDQEAAARLQAVLDIMHQAQGQVTHFDARI